MSATKFRVTSTAASQRGAALVVGLVLLMVLTVLAISGMNTSTVELQMAGNMQFSQNAFQAAETGIEVEIAQPGPLVSAAEALPRAAVTIPDTADTYQILAACSPDNGKTPAVGGSIGEYAAYHTDVRSTGRSARGSRSVHVQSHYVVGPDSGPC